MNLLENLSNAFGVSSVEEDVRRIIVDAVKPHVDELRADTMGNLFALRRARQPRPGQPLRVMVTAHMDEVGFLITKINGNGQLKFNTVGGFDPRVLLGKSVVVGPKRLPGVIGMKPVHLLSSSERRKVSSTDSMFIDIGASSDSPGGVKPGDFATFATQFSHLGAQPDPETAPRSGQVMGKAFDNRVGCALLVELMQGDYPVDVLGVFTVQEEVGLRGARVAAYSANPDVALVLECTAADDLPRLNEGDEPGIPRLGLGPALTVMDRTVIADRRWVDLLINTAVAHSIPYQFKRPGIGGTDAGAIHVAREGIPTAVVSVPARYIHSPAAIIDLADFWATEQLVRATLGRLPEINWT